MTLTVFDPLTSEVGEEDARADFLFSQLRTLGVAVKRLTPLDAPEAFENLAAKGVPLPAVFVDNTLKCAGHYPTNAELASWVNYDEKPDRGCRGGCHARKE